MKLQETIIKFSSRHKLPINIASDVYASDAPNECYNVH